MKQSTTALILATIAMLSVSHRTFAADCTQSSDASIASAKSLNESDRTRGKKPDDADSDDSDGASKAGSGESRERRGPPPGGFPDGPPPSGGFGFN
jgi:hypothetical protein